MLVLDGLLGEVFESLTLELMRLAIDSEHGISKPKFEANLHGLFSKN